MVIGVLEVALRLHARQYLPRNFTVNSERKITLSGHLGNPVLLTLMGLREVDPEEVELRVSLFETLVCVH